jgi:DNA mismatch repair protein MutL
VNVHPRKDEVRFSNPRQIHSAVFHLLRDGLARAPWAAGRILPTVPARFDPAPPAFALRSDPPNAPLPLWLGAGRVADGEGGPVPFAPAPPLPEAAASAPFPDAPPDDSSSRPAGFFARLVPVGQAFLTYLVCQSDDRLILIDQHAAHERIVYEDLRRAIARGAVPSQALLSPESFPVPPELLALLEDEGETLARLGFDVEPFGPDRARLRAHPAGLALPPAEALRRTLETLRHGPGAERSTLERGLETVACHSAVRAGRRLAEPEILALLQRMDEVDFGAFCPHGRPAWVGVSRDDIERMFHRR